MTDANPGSEAPPKKKSLFKKSAWQRKQEQAQAGGEAERDMFSHSNDFKDIVAEETKRKLEERRKLEEARKHKADQERERKRRKVSTELDEPKLPSASGSSAHASRVGNKGRSKTPLSPIPKQPPPTDTLSTRYDSLTKSSSNASIPQKALNIIDLGDTDDEDPWKASPTPTKPCIPIHTAKRASSEEIEEVEDPSLAKLKAQARARAAERAARQTQVSASTPAARKPKTAIVQLFITSEIPDTKPLLVKVRTDTTIEKPKDAWCAKQGFSSEKTKDVFMTWKGNRVYDTTTIQRLGVHVDANGCVSVDGDTNIYDDVNLPKVHLDAWTEEVYQQWKKEEAEAAAAKKRAAEPPPLVKEPSPEPAPEPQVKKIRVIMKTKGREDFKIIVKQETEFGHLASVFKQNRGVPPEQPITLMFDGDRLPPMDTIADAEIEDMDSIDVLFK